MAQLRIQERLAERARGRESSPIRALFPYLSIPGMISFGGGYPNPETFPFTGMELSFQGGETVRIEGAQVRPMLQYGPSDADLRLGGLLRRWHKYKDGIELSKDSLVVLNGSQEGLFILGYLFLEPSDSVVVSEPTYPGALSAFRSFTQRFVSVPLDGEGMDTKRLEEILERMRGEGRRMPKLVYCIPNGHNPGGVSLSSPRREKLLEIAKAFDLLILEDDPYQLVRLEDSPPKKTLQSMDEEGRVIRLDSFSKIFAPGLRVGYASGDPKVIHQCVLFKQSANLHTGTLAQNILAAFLEAARPDGFMARIKENCALYRRNRDDMIRAAQDLLPKEVRFDRPEDGMFLWFRLPPYCRSDRMIKEYAEELKVVLVPGPAFSAQGNCMSCMRASFSMVSREEIRQGMERFAEMIRREESR